MTDANNEKQESDLTGSVNGDYIQFSTEFNDPALNNSGIPMNKINFSGILANNQLIKGRYSVELQTQSNVWMAYQSTEEESQGNSDE